jgi:hypothetical protein
MEVIAGKDRPGGMKGGREVAGGAVVAEEEEAPDAGAMVI